MQVSSGTLGLLGLTSAILAAEAIEKDCWIRIFVACGLAEGDAYALFQQAAMLGSESRMFSRAQVLKLAGAYLASGRERDKARERLTSAVKLGDLLAPDEAWARGSASFFLVGVWDEAY